MPDDAYSLSDLARLADVTPRTIRYYVAQGLLPAPEAAGPATTYGEGHLARLRLIKRLQRDHLPLAEIRGQIERMGDEDVRQLLEATPEQAVLPAPAETLAFVRDLMAQSGLRPRVSESRALYMRAESSVEPTQEPTPMPSPASPALPAAPPRSAVGDRSTWERLVLAPDVELQVRRPLDRRINKRVDQLIRIARELFDEEP